MPLSGPESRELDGIRNGLDGCLEGLARAELSWIGGGPSALAAVAAGSRRFAEPGPYRFAAGIEPADASILALRRGLGRAFLQLRIAPRVDEQRRQLGMASARLEGESLPPAGVVREIRWERDAPRRRRLGAALEEARRLLAPAEERVLGSAWEAARELGHDGLHAALAAWHGPDLGQLPARAAEFLRASAELARETIAGEARRALQLPPGELHWEDLVHHLQGAHLRHEISEPFLPTMAAGFLDRAGIPRTVMARIRRPVRGERCPTLVAVTLPVAPPDEVAMSVDAGGGLREHAAYLRELGRAIAYAAGDGEAPVEQRRALDEVAVRSVGLLMEGLLANPVFLRRVVKVSRPRELARLPRAATLARARARAAHVRLHAELEGSGRIASAGELHREITSQALLAAPPALPDLTLPEEAALWLAAFPYSCALADHLRDRFDEDWFLNPRTGRHLLGLLDSGGALDIGRMAAAIGPVPQGEELCRRLEREAGS